MEPEKNSGKIPYIKVSTDPNVEYKIVAPSIEQFDALERRIRLLERDTHPPMPKDTSERPDAPERPEIRYMSAGTITTPLDMKKNYDLTYGESCAVYLDKTGLDVEWTEIDPAHIPLAGLSEVHAVLLRIERLLKNGPPEQSGIPFSGPYSAGAGRCLGYK